MRANLFQVLGSRAGEGGEDAAYRAGLEWAARRGDRFELGLERAAYERPEERARLRRLGTVAPSGQDPGLELIAGPLPATDWVGALTLAPPARARLDGPCPVDFVVVWLKARALWVAYDYGLAQTMNLTTDEREDFAHVLVATGLPEDCLIPLRG